MSLATLARKTKAKQRLRTRGKFILNMTGRGNVLGMNAKMSRGNCKGLTNCAGKRASCCVGVGGSQCCEFPHGGQPAPQQGYRVYLNRKSKGAYRPAGGKQCKTLAGCTSAKTVWKQGNNLDASVVTTNRRDNVLACNSDVYTAKKDTCTGCPIAKIEDNTITQDANTVDLGGVRFQASPSGPFVDYGVGNPDGPGALPVLGDITNIISSQAENGYIQNELPAAPFTSSGNFRLYYLDDTSIAAAGFYFTPSWDNTLWQNPFHKSPVLFTSITFTDGNPGGTGDTLTYFYKDSIGFKEDPIALGLTGTSVTPCTTRFFEKGFINGSEATVAEQKTFFANTAQNAGGFGGRDLNISVLRATRISQTITASPAFNNDSYPNINTGTLTPAGEKMFPEPSKARILIEPGVFPEFTIFGGRNNYPIPGFYAIQFRARGNGVASQGQTVTLLYKDAVKYTENGVGPMLAWTPGSGGAGGFGSPLSYSNGQSIGISGESITSTSLESFFTGAGPTDNVEITVIGPFFNTIPPSPSPPCCPVKKNICGCRATDLLRYTRINKSFGCQTTKAVRMGRSASEQIARRRAAVDCIAPKHRSIYLTIDTSGNISFDGCCGNQCLIQGQQYTFQIKNNYTVSSLITFRILWCQQVPGTSIGIFNDVSIPQNTTVNASFTVPKFNNKSPCNTPDKALLGTLETNSNVLLDYCKQAYKRPQMLGSCSGR